MGCPTDSVTRSTRPTHLCPTRHHPIRRLRRLDTGSKLTNPTPRGLVVGFPFETHDTRPKPNPFSFRRVITNFQPVWAKSDPDPSRSDEISPLSNEIWARSQRIRPNLGQISTNLVRFWPDLVGSGQISAPVIKPETDPNQPETDETRTEKSDQISRSISSQFFIHPPHLGRVWVGHKPDLDRLMDTPGRNHHSQSFLTFL